ncbi:MAG: hypothetical protein AAFQ43_12035 [Bacteroidota bacterium]
MLNHLHPFRRRTVARSLYHMLTGPRFDLCTVYDALAAAGLDAPRDAIAALRLHHCVQFSEMPPDVRTGLTTATLELFATAPEDCDTLTYLAREAGLSAATPPLPS